LGTVQTSDVDCTILQSLTADADPEIRMLSATALGTHRLATDALADAARDPVKQVRQAALRALSKSARPADLNILLEGFDDADLVTIEALAVALGQIGDDTIVPNLQSALARCQIDQSSEDALPAIKQILDALGRIGGLLALEILVDVYNSTANRNRSRARQSRHFLDTPPHKKIAQNVLISSVKADILPASKVEAILALTACLDEVPVKEILLALKSDAPEVGDAAAQLLIKMGAEDALLIAIMNNEVYVREVAARALAEIASAKSLPELIHTLKQEPACSTTELQIIKALERVGDVEALDSTRGQVERR
jgi:HEAT repeat protein